MDAKDLRTEAALGDRSNDGNSKYVQGGGSLPCHRNKAYQDITSNSLVKVDTPVARPCAVIGPDRVVPPAPPAHSDVYYKKGPPEPWLTPENTYRRPPDYPHKLLDYQHPSRNISPRQTFQENMQRIMVAPSYNTGKLKEDHNYPGESNISQMRNNKLTVPPDSNSKYCDVPYTVNPITTDHKNVRNSDISVSNMNTVLSRSMPQGWASASANIPPPKSLPQDLCQYPEYQNCPAPRPVVMARPHRAVHEEPGPVYPEGFYHNGNIRFKPYPPVKERYPQTRYEYIGNYSNPFHPPPPFPTHKYDLQKPMPPYPHPTYPQVPLKYLDNRMTDSIMNGYQRSLNQQAAYSSMPYRNQVIHPTYGPVPGSCLPSNKFYPYPPDASKSLPSNKLPFDSNNKLYPDYEQSNRNKNFPVSDTFYINEIARPHPTKGTVIPSNYPSNIHAMPTHPYYRKEPLKGYEYSPHFRNMDHMLGVNGNLMSRFPSQFSPSAIAISPTDSNTSNETNLTHAISQEDCGYVSQSSTASARSMDSIINKLPHDMYRRYDHSYGHIIKGSAPFAKIDQSSNVNLRSKDKKDIDVRQFLQMWNEGEEEGNESNKEANNKHSSNSVNNSINAASCGTTNQEQLYVLGLVNVPSEELSKYQHIQKVSKLPENIKGYNSIELLHQFEEVVESSNINHYNDHAPATRSFQNTFKNTVPMHGLGIPSRPLSPLDVEAKISQSVIHKEVGCNFEIKPCSPKMLNVEVATPAQTVIGERMIEKVSNPLISHSPVMQNVNENRDDCKVVKSQDRLAVHDNTKIASCKMVSKLYGNKDLVDPVKTNYSIHDLESNSGVCLASLPRLDNDIELNFPEVNQQFINANKVDSVITTGPMKDLPPLDTNQTDPINREQETDFYNSHMKRNSEKDFSKLSKYRKMKRRVSGSSTPDSNVQALRTDSVIIKNPDNCKHENLETVLSPRTVLQEAQNDPINLSVNNEHCVKSNTIDFSLNKSVEDKPNDFAIDFSINANDSSNFTDVITLPETNPIEKHTLNRDMAGRKGQYEKNLSPKHTVSNEDGTILNDNDMKKPNESKLDFSMEPSASDKANDFTINNSETHSKENLKSRKEINVALQDTNSEQTQKYIETNKETLNKKLSSYNLLTSQEKEDTLNEKMRELFGEEFSTAETEPDFEEVHDTQAILDDDAAQEKDCLFSDESSKQDDEVAIKCNVSNYREKEERKLSENMILHDLTDTGKIENYLLLETSTTKVDISEKDGNETDDRKSFKPYKTKNNVKSTTGDIKDCTVEHKSPEADLCRIKKELLSPWIQKLILHNEGLYATTDVKEAQNYHVDDELHTNIYNENIKTSNEDENNETMVNFENPAVVNIDDDKNNQSECFIDTIRDFENVKLKNDKMDLNIKAFKHTKFDDNSEILAMNTAKDLKADKHEIDKKLACHGKLGVFETPELMPKMERRVSDQSDKMETNYYTNAKTNLSCEISMTDSADILEIANENKTSESIKSCVKMKNDSDMFGSIHSIEDGKNKRSDTAKMFTVNDNETNKSLKNSNEPGIDLHVQDLIGSNNTTCSENLVKNTADKDTYVPEATLCYKTHENLENLVDVKEIKTKSAVDHEIDKDVKNSMIGNDPNTIILDRTINQVTEECKLKSDACGHILAKTELKSDTNIVLKAPNIGDIKENLGNYDLESITNTSVLMMVGSNESYQETERDTDKISEIGNKERTCKNNDLRKTKILCSGDSETLSEKSNQNNTMINRIQDNGIINHKVDSETCKSVHKVDGETCKSDLKSERDNKSNHMQEVIHSDMNKEQYPNKHKEFEDFDIQLVKNCQSEHSLSGNKISEKIIFSKSPEPSVVPLNTPIRKDHEQHTENMSYATSSSMSRLLNNDTIMDSSGSDESLAMMKGIDEYSVRNDNADLKSEKDDKINNIDSLDDRLHLHEETENVPFLLSNKEEKQSAFLETILATEIMSVSHSDSDSNASSQDYSSMNGEEPIQTLFDQKNKDFSTINETYEYPDEGCSQFKETNNKLLISGHISNKDNIVMTVPTTNQIEPMLEELSSCSDISNETTSSDDENTSDSSDSNEFLDNDETIKNSIDNNENKSHFSAECEHDSLCEESDNSSFINSSNVLKEINDTGFESNDKSISNTSLNEDIAVLNDENLEIEREYTVEDSNCEEYEPNCDDSNILSKLEREKNEAEQAIPDCVKEPDFDDSNILSELEIEKNEAEQAIPGCVIEPNFDDSNILSELEIEKNEAEQAIPGCVNEPNFDDSNILSELEIEKNEAEQAIPDCSEIVKSIDFSVDESDMVDSGFMLETSQDDTKHEEIVESVYNKLKLSNDCKNERLSTNKRRKSLKRSLSDSALDDIRDSFTEDSVLWPSKRKKDIEINNYNTSQLIAQNICRVLQSNRRNSISSIHNDGNVSFCILIDNNCIISEECDEPEKICFSEVPEDCVTCIQAESVNQDSIEDNSSLEQDANCVFSMPIQTNEEDKILNEPWVEDIACVETVISDDIAENIVISASASPRDEECNDEETEIYNINEHTDKLKFIYGDKIYSDDAHFVDTLYRTPQMNVNKTLSNRESQITIDDSRYYDKESLERVLSESIGQDKCTDLVAFPFTTPLPSPVISELSPNYNENVISENHKMRTLDTPVFENKECHIDRENREEYKELPMKEMKENMNSSESIENVYNCMKAEESHKSNISSSPEVSSTTSEEKNAGILLKITSYGGSRVSQINNITPIQSISCKYTEKKEYLSCNSNLPTRTLITKAAQKYIPPIKESIRDLKVKLPLPHQSLVKLRQLKMAKEASKPNLDRSTNTFTKNVPKKSKPKFEDVLKSIDELQYQKHKEKNKKARKSIPKVVIKKNVLGSHYASTSSKHPFNPDLTGRKWQPWVFLERDNFIDKMALRKKTRAIFSHRKQSYVLAEKFQKYKSVCNPKFVISQPKQNDSMPGKLKYTIRLKHTY